MMRDNRRIACETVQAIKTAIREAESAGHPVDAVFIGTDLRYLIAALPESPLRYSMDKGELIFGRKVIRYMSDDLTQFFLAQSRQVSKDIPAAPVHRPYMRKPK